MGKVSRAPVFLGRSMEDKYVQILLSRSYVDANGCWIWTGTVGGSSYPVVERGVFPTKTQHVHRIVGQMHPDFKPGMYALHRCNVRVCVNPDHIYPGTQSNNMVDRVKAGRQNTQKLTELQVLKIRWYVASGVPKTTLARVYGVERKAIRRCCDGTTWSHL